MPSRFNLRTTADYGRLLRGWAFRSGTASRSHAAGYVASFAGSAQIAALAGLRAL